MNKPHKLNFERIGDGGLVTKSCPTLAIPWTVPARLFCPGDSPGKNTGVGCQEISQM